MDSSRSPDDINAELRRLHPPGWWYVTYIEDWNRNDPDAKPRPPLYVESATWFEYREPYMATADIGSRRLYRFNWCSTPGARVGQHHVTAPRVVSSDPLLVELTTADDPNRPWMRGCLRLTPIDPGSV